MIGAVIKFTLFNLSEIYERPIIEFLNIYLYQLNEERRLAEEMKKYKQAGTWK